MLDQTERFYRKFLTTLLKLNRITGTRYISYFLVYLNMKAPVFYALYLMYNVVNL